MNIFFFIFLVYVIFFIEKIETLKFNREINWESINRLNKEYKKNNKKEEEIIIYKKNSFL